MKNRFNKAPTETKSLFDLLTHKYIALGAPLPDHATRQRGTSDYPRNKIFPIKLASFGISSYLCQREIKMYYMATLSMEQVYMEVPSTEIAFLRTLAKKMGWAIKRQRKSGIQEALEDVEAGRVYEAENVEDLMAQLNA